MYKKPPAGFRNMKGIEHEEIRAKIDGRFNDCHDELSDCYYNKKPFAWGGKNYGLLDKETFDKLHGLIFDLRELHFDLEARTGGDAKKYINKIQQERLEIAKKNIASLQKNGLSILIF